MIHAPGGICIALKEPASYSQGPIPSRQEKPFDSVIRFYYCAHCEDCAMCFGKKYICLTQRGDSSEMSVITSFCALEPEAQATEKYGNKVEGRSHVASERKRGLVLISVGRRVCPLPRVRGEAL